MDDFNLGDPLADPLDFTSVQTPPFVGGPSSPKQGQTQAGGFDKKQAMKLAILLPLAAKAGPGAVQGLLQGFTQAQQRAQQQGRQDRMDADTQAQRDWQRQYQQGQLDNQRRQQGLAFTQNFSKGLEGLDTPEAIDAYLKLQTQMGQPYGITPDQLSGLAAPYKEPSRLQRKAADNYVKRLKEQYGTDWMETAGGFSHKVGGETLTLDQLLERTGQVRDPNAPKAAGKPETRSLDVQAADALAKGDTETYQRLLRVKKEMGLADNAPPKGPDPVLEEMRQIRLEQMKAGGQQLPPATQRRVDAKAKGFDSLPVVKTIQKQAEAVSFANSLDPNTKNPADDQALIYAFAKAMDPDSVVREGEYATVQKYAQSWAQTFQFNAARVFSNTAFLTPQARANMKRTIQAKYRAGKAQYDNVRKSYASQINKITNQGDGEDWLTDYAGGFPHEQSAAPAAPAAPGKSQRIGRFEVTVE